MLTNEYLYKIHDIYNWLQYNGKKCTLLFGQTGLYVIKCKHTLFSFCASIDSTKTLNCKNDKKGEMVVCIHFTFHWSLLAWTYATMLNFKLL